MNRTDWWTAEQEKLLLEICVHTHRTSDIARALEPIRAGTTKNSVVGKIQRLRKLGHRITTGLPGGGYSEQHKRRKVRKTEQSFARVEIPRMSTLPKPRRGLPAPEPLRPEPMPFTMRRLALLELGPRDCRWPVGDVGEPDFCFCGNPTDPERVYCPVHHAIAHGR